MKQLKLPNPPNPDDSAYRMNQMQYQRDIYRWMTETKGKIEIASVINDTPLDQNFVIGTYVLSTALSGTSTGTDMANFICSLVSAFTKKGIIKTVDVNRG